MISPERMSREDLIDEIEHLRGELGLSRRQDVERTFIRRWGLSPKQAQLLAALHSAKGRVLSKERAMDILYAGRDEPELKIIDVFISKLRKSIAAEMVRTEWGAGYSLSALGMATCEELIATPYAQIEACARSRRTTRGPVRTLLILRALAAGARTNAEVSALSKIAKPHTSALIQSARRYGRAEIIAGGGGPGRIAWYALTEAGRAYLALHAEGEAIAA